MSNLTKLGDYREFRTNEQWENKTRQEGGCLSSLEVLKSNTSCRGYPKKRWESKKKQVIFYGFPSIVQELNFFLPLSWNCQRCYTNMTVRDPWALLGLIFFQLLWVAGWWPSDHCLTSFCWSSVNENHSQVWPANGVLAQEAIALAITCSWGGPVKLWYLRWTPKRRKQIVTGNHKQSQEDLELRERKPVLWRTQASQWRPLKLSSRLIADRHTPLSSWGKLNLPTVGSRSTLRR